MNSRRTIVIVALCALTAAALLFARFAWTSGGSGAAMRRAADEAAQAKASSSPENDQARSSPRTRWTPSAEDQLILDAARNAAPDPFGNELPEVLASLPPEDRELVLFAERDETERWYVARAWALKDGVVKGDAREVSMFLETLRPPLPADEIEFGHDRPRDGAVEHRRNFALVALCYATMAGDAHRARFPEFESLAIEHLQAPAFDGNAVLLLHFLNEQNSLSKEGKAAYERELERPRYDMLIENWARGLRADFVRR